MVCAKLTALLQLNAAVVNGVLEIGSEVDVIDSIPASPPSPVVTGERGERIGGEADSVSPAEEAADENGTRNEETHTSNHHCPHLNQLDHVTHQRRRYGTHPVIFPNVFVNRRSHISL